MTDFATIMQLLPGYDPVATAGLAGASWSDVCDPAVGDYWFDEQSAQMALDFFEHPTDHCLRHVKGELAGHPLTLAPWQKAIVGNIFGWKTPEGLRRYRRVWIYVPRKNGKSTLAAGIMLYIYFTDDEPGQELYSAAADTDQAKLIFDIARGMIEQEPLMESRCRCYTSYKSIEMQDGIGYWKVLSSDAKTKHGKNSHAYTADEIHAHKNRELVDVLMTSTGSRRQPLEILTTTADWDHPSACNELLKEFQDVRDGITEDPTALPAIYEADREDDWTDPEVWAKANPNLGISVKEGYLRRQCERAQNDPSYLNTFLRLHLNIKTGQSTALVSLPHWDECAGAVVAADLAGEPCYAGLDLSSTTDFTACVLWFPEQQAVLPHFWIPSDTMHERAERGLPIDAWVREGHVRVTDGNVVDYGILHDDLVALGETYQIQGIAFDPWNATQLATQLGERFDMVEFRQGYASMNEPTKEFVARVLSGRLNHGGHPVLRWMVSNLAGVTKSGDDADNIKPSKKQSGDRIDGPVALIMAMGLAMVQPTARQSVYEERGLITI